MLFVRFVSRNALTVLKNGKNDSRNVHKRLRNCKNSWILKVVTAFVKQLCEIIYSLVHMVYSYTVYIYIFIYIRECEKCFQKVRSQ